MFGSKEKASLSVIRLLRESLSTEAAAYAEIKNIKYRQSTTSSEIALLLDKFEERYKGTKHGLAKTSEKLKWQN